MPTDFPSCISSCSGCAGAGGHLTSTPWGGLHPWSLLASSEVHLGQLSRRRGKDMVAEDSASWTNSAVTHWGRGPGPAFAPGGLGVVLQAVLTGSPGLPLRFFATTTTGLLSTPPDTGEQAPACATSSLVLLEAIIISYERVFLLPADRVNVQNLK